MKKRSLCVGPIVLPRNLIFRMTPLVADTVQAIVQRHPPSSQMITSLR
jgi:hypothetical protein